jgi:hypothetical protein
MALEYWVRIQERIMLSINMRTVVLRVNPIREMEGSIESTTYRSWHDSIMLI